MRIAAVLVGALACVAATGGQAAAMQAPAEPSTVSELEVVATADIRVSVAPGGDIDAKTYIVSAPIGMYCGGAEYQYSTRENRQCWLWVRRNSEVVLTAQSSGGYGVAWTVQWIGCEPIGNGAACVVNPKAETRVAALFTRPANP